MRTMKLIGPTALAALIAMALVSSSSAMAEGSTALCKKDQTPCEAANLLGSVHAESVGKAILLNGSFTVECNVLFSGTAKLGNPATITGNFTYSNCTNTCSVTEQSLFSTINLLALGHELADVTGEGQVKITCILGFMKCVYNGTGLKGHGLGPLLSSGSVNGEVRIEGQQTHIFSGVCPNDAFLDLLIAPLTLIYLSA